MMTGVITSTMEVLVKTRTVHKTRLPRSVFGWLSCLVNSPCFVLHTVTQSAFSGSFRDGKSYVTLVLKFV